MPDGAGQDRLPAGHAGVEGGAQGRQVAGQDRGEAVLSGLAQPLDPLGIQVLFDQGVVAFGPGAHGQHVQHPLQPAGDVGIAGGFDVAGVDPAPVGEVVIDPVHPGIDEADHVLGARGLGLAPVLRLVEFLHQLLRGARGQAAPEAPDHRPGPGGDARTLHPVEGGLHADDHHGTGRGRVQPGTERLVDPPSGEGEAIGDLPYGILDPMGGLVGHGGHRIRDRGRCACRPCGPGSAVRSRRRCARGPGAGEWTAPSPGSP